METKVKKVERVITEDVTVYIACDGAEFKDKYSCEKYETEFSRKAALQRNDIEINKSLSGHFPITASLPNYDYDYIWVCPNTQDAADVLQDAFRSDYSDARFVPGQWMCIELDYDDNVDLYSESSIKDGVKAQLNALGIKVTFNYM